MVYDSAKPSGGWDDGKKFNCNGTIGGVHRFMRHASEGLPLGEVPGEPPPGVKSGDRGGTKGRSVDGPMPLVPPKKVKSIDTPPGVHTAPMKHPPAG